MSRIYFTPGPSQLYPTVKKHIQTALKEDICSISHRSKKYIQIQKGVFDKLRQVYNIPEDYTMFVGGSGTYFMEKVIQNCVKENSFHFVNGSFSRRFYEISRDLQKNAKQVKFKLGQGIDIKKADTEELKKAEFVAFTACETSTGAHFVQDDIYKISQSYPQAIHIVDTVSASPMYDLNFKLVDGMIFSSQKGFGLPAGLGILICSPKAIQKSYILKDLGYNTGSYHSFPLVVKKAKEYQTLETPNVLAMYLLDKVLQDMLDYGIDRMREDVDYKYQILKDFFENHPDFSFYIKEENYRSKTVVVISCKNPTEVQERIAKYGFILGGGYGEDKDTQFRIANFPAISIKNMQDLITAFKKEF
jgi:phosphoserine aminotransferase